MRRVVVSSPPADAGTDVLEFLKRHGVRVALDAAAPAVPQSTASVLMVAPTGFSSNAAAALDNAFMARTGAAEAAGTETRRAVLEEHAGLVAALAGAGVDVRLVQHEDDTPDAVFPNNWFSTHTAESVGERVMTLYPMKVENRRRERRADLVEMLRPRYDRVVDLTPAEREATPRFLEGTGSMVLDHGRKVAYLARSERSDESLAREWAQEVGFRDVLAFDATDEQGRPVYHTNVVMAVGSTCAIVCTESVEDAGERRRLVDSLERDVVHITRRQMSSFCGNAIELLDRRGLPVLALSNQALAAFSPTQRAQLERHFASFVHAPIDTLEAVGGGGVRCAIAELYDWE